MKRAVIVILVLLLLGACSNTNSVSQQNGTPTQKVLFNSPKSGANEDDSCSLAWKDLWDNTIPSYGLSYEVTNGFELFVSNSAILNKGGVSNLDNIREQCNILRAEDEEHLPVKRGIVYQLPYKGKVYWAYYVG